MSEAKFTKGEWFIEKNANWNDNCWAISVTRPHGSVHHCFAEVVHKMECDEESNPELEANAYLIATAPDLYQILYDLRQAISLGGMGGGINNHEVLKSIDHQLAKARGETTTDKRVEK